MAREPKPRGSKASRTSSVNEKAAAASEGAAARAAAAPPSGSPRDRVIDALFRLAEDHRWDEIELGDIAREAGVTLAELRDLFPSKGAILGAYSRRVDKVVLEGTTDDLVGESVRERLFDVLMRRLDAMTPQKAALKAIARDLRMDPLSMAALNQVALNSQRYMLAAAGISTEGPAGALKVQGAVLLFARVLDTWFRDDDPGLSRTMAALDKELERAGRNANALSDLCRIASPFRALFERVADGPRRFRERASRDRDDRRSDEDPDEDYAPAI
jgi:AcrR family transcriptional regulator